MATKIKKMWVSEEFKNLFKSKASQEGKSIIEFSKDVAKSMQEQPKTKPQKKKGGFYNDFYF